MEEKIVFEGTIDGKVFDDYKEFLTYLQKHPESDRANFSLRRTPVARPTSAVVTDKDRKASQRIQVEGRTINPGKVINSEEALYPVLETPDQYLANRPQERWKSDIDLITNSLKKFMFIHESNIKRLSNEELEKHLKVLEKCQTEVIQAIDYNNEAAKKVESTIRGYQDEVTKLNAEIKECRQRINEIRREHIARVESKKQPLEVVGDLLDVYNAAYCYLMKQVQYERKVRQNRSDRNAPANFVSGSPGVAPGDHRSMTRLLKAIFG